MNLGSPAKADFVPFTTAEHIQQINDIDQRVTTLLQSVGHALKLLTASKLQSSSATDAKDRREEFRNATNTFLKTLHAVDIGLQRQIMSLEEESIIPPETPKARERAARAGVDSSGPADKEIVGINDGGMGKLDVGWLNSRGGRVERSMEADLWSSAKSFLETVDLEGGVLKPKNSKRDEDHDMDT
ncbi:mediator complex protein-domain-containing protein [Bisporella sp. PMI_857]|nr:mediator complex protein-domain-containing protein [Bisporella sp. PMI_857]